MFPPYLEKFSLEVSNGHFPLLNKKINKKMKIKIKHYKLKGDFFQHR